MGFEEELLETIKRTLFDTGIISSDRLDPADIATLNKSSFDDGTWFCLVKRAAAEWQLDRDYQKQPRQEAEELPEPKSTPKSTDKLPKKGESLKAKSDKQERSIELKVSKIDGPPTIELVKLTWTLEMLIRQLKLPMRDVRFTDLKGNDRRQIWVRVPGGYGHSTIPVRFDQGSQDLIVGPMDLLPVFVDPAFFSRQVYGSMRIITQILYPACTDLTRHPLTTWQVITMESNTSSGFRFERRNLP